MNYLTEDLIFTVPLTSEAYIKARKYSSEHQNTNKSQQIYRNILAVQAALFYCQSMGIETDQKNSDRFNITTQILMNIADLELTNFGKLECIPVIAGNKNCHIPPETWENRIGYLIVEIDESTRKATLKKFLPPLHPLQMKETFAIAELASLDRFLEHIANLEEAIAFLQSQDAIASKVRDKLEEHSIPEIATQLELIYRTYPPEEKGNAIAKLLSNQLILVELTFPLSLSCKSKTQEERKNLELAHELLSKLGSIWNQEPPVTKPLINLSELVQDLTQVVRVGWQTLEDFINSPEYSVKWHLAGNMCFRNSALANLKIVKTVTIGEGDKYSVILSVEVEQKLDGINDCAIRVSSFKDDSYLPPNLQLTVLDDRGSVCLQKQTGNTDFWLQLSLQGELGDEFTLKVELEDTSFKENFKI